MEVFVSFLNRQPTFSLVAGTTRHAPRTGHRLAAGLRAVPSCRSIRLGPGSFIGSRRFPAMTARLRRNAVRVPGYAGFDRPLLPVTANWRCPNHIAGDLTELGEPECRPKKQLRPRQRAKRLSGAPRARRLDGRAERLPGASVRSPSCLMISWLKGPAVKSGHQLWTIGYFAKIASICLYALSAAASGVIPPRMMSAQAALQTWVF